MTETRNLKLRVAALTALGASLLVAAVPALAGSPVLAGWVWIR